jgi:transcriptional regulator GlxA family with amidase domain
MAETFTSVVLVTDRSYARGGRILTCPGGTAAIDLALALVEDYCGRARATKALMSLLVEKQRADHEMLHRLYQGLTAYGNWRVEKAVDLMEQYALAHFSIKNFARRIGSTPRELNKVFVQIAGELPGAIQCKIGLTHAHWMPLNTHRKATDITLECGFSDLAHFSQWFREEYGEPPATFCLHRQVEGRSDPDVTPWYRCPNSLPGTPGP